MKTITSLFIIVGMNIAYSFGQSNTEKLAEADDLYLQENFARALPLYLEFQNTYSSNVNLDLKIGVCYLNSRSQKIKAIGHLQKAAGPNSPAIAHKLLGDAYLLGNKYDSALISYEKFKKTVLTKKSSDMALAEEVNWKLKMCNIGKKINEADSTDLTLDSNNIGYTSTLSPDQSAMNFTFQRPDNPKSQSLKDEKYYTHLYIPANTVFTRSVNINIDTTTDINEATVATSEDGQIVLNYKDDNGDGNLYITRLMGNTWTKPERVNKTTNTRGWETNEYMTADGDMLYFTSDRPGGFGGKDIYVCKKSPSGEWGKAANLGPGINTAFDEQAPVIYSDGITLFFSSNKNKQTCCFDLFSSMLKNDGSWSAPTKIGYPVKTENDALYAATTDSKEIPTGKTKTNADTKKDNYLAAFIDQNKVSYTVLKGKVTDIAGKVPAKTKISVIDNATGEILGLYSPDYETGNYIISMPAGRNNNIIYEANGYLFQSENVDLSRKTGNYESRYIVQLPQIAPGAKTTLKNTFFDFDRPTIRAVSNTELNKIYHFLSTNIKTEIELSYHTTAKENVKYSAKLSEERAEEVAKYLIVKGISKDRVRIKASEKTKEPKQGKNTEQTIAVEIASDRLELKIIEIK